MSLNDHAAVGVEAMGFATSRYFLDLATLARQRGLRPFHFYRSVGQEKMAAPPPGEDVVTLGANAAAEALAGHDRELITLVLFATESGIDQSKAAGIYVHRLLGLPSRCRVVELKQACYGATAGLHLGLALVRAQPAAKILLIASDVARYGLDTPGEATQGAGAVAMLLSASPRLLAVEPHAGCHTEDVMDFWRPNYREEPFVDGKASVRVYLRALLAAYDHYAAVSGRTFNDLQRCCYHLPFTRMAATAHAHLAKHVGAALGPLGEAAQIEDALAYNRVTGNCYTASLYLGLLSLLDHSREDLAGQRLGLFSYGSGCVGEFFSGVVPRGYRAHLGTVARQQALAARHEVDYATYERFYRHALPQDGSDYAVPPHETGRFRLVGIRGHQRRYEAVAGG